MEKILFIIVISLFCISCGVKNKPEYNSQINLNKTVLVI